MIDEANQAEETIEEEELDYFLPDDYVEGEDDESTDDSEESEEVKEDDKETQDEEETDEETDEESKKEEEQTNEATLGDLEVKFLHEVKTLKDIPREELQTYIQKGMNHDRVQEKLTVANEQVEMFKEVAELFGMDISQVVESLKDQHFTSKADEEGRKVEDVRREHEGNKQDRADKMYNRFVTKYPDVKELPSEVNQSVSEGEDLVSAYEKYMNDTTSKSKDTEIADLKAKIEQFQKKEEVKTQNTKTKKKAVVKKTSGSNEIVNDDFLSGFLD